MKNKQNLIWIDLEMTGLNPEQDYILEIATIITDQSLNILAEGPVFAINQSAAVLQRMDEWNQKQHNQSGLVQRVLSSQINVQQAEAQTMAFLQIWLDPGESPMCGNSICLDKRFLCRYMPALAAFFHYRLLDVSTVKELAKRWRPDLIDGFTKESKHIALEDIKDSIAELKYYRENFIHHEHTPT